LNDIGRNSLLGNRKKIAKFLMRTFNCRSTFLYGQSLRGRRHNQLAFLTNDWQKFHILLKDKYPDARHPLSLDWDTLFPMLSSGRYCWQGSPLWLFTVLFSPCAETSAFQQS
jgi:hypothetical protein